MKKYAMTLLEVLIAMGLVVAASVLMMNIVQIYNNKDTDIVKFKHAFGTVSDVVYALKSDTCEYPKVEGFSYQTASDCPNTDKKYSGSTKFQKLFKSKFNVLENNIRINPGSPVPKIKYKDDKGDEHSDTNSEITCFTENKGFMFCPPDFSLGTSDSLVSLFIPVYVNHIDLNNPATTNIEKAIFIEVGATGKIEIPPIVYAQDKIAIDCTNMHCASFIEDKEKYQECLKTNGSYNDYSHCKVLDKMLDIDF